MEGRLAATALVFTIIAACSKLDLDTRPSQQTSLTQTALQKEVYTSGWESIPAWTVDKNTGSTILSYSRNLPELNSDILEKGAVLVFVRNLWPEGIGDGETGKPLMMPFYFLPYFEKPDYTEEWNYTIKRNVINITLLIKGSKQPTQPNKKVQLRYVVIPVEKLKAKKQTTQTVRKASYDEVVQMFDLAS